MSSFNKVIIMGNLTRDPETRYTPKGTAVGEIGVAVNRRVKINEEWKDEVTFVDVTLWGTTAENVQKYLGKGSGIHVEGRLQMDTWEDKQSGQKRSKLKVVAESVQFVGSKRDSESSDRARETAGQRQERERRQGQQGGGSPGYMSDALDQQGGGYQDEEDDIPF